MIIPVMFFLMAYTYAIAVNFVPSYRDPADKIGKSDLVLAPLGKAVPTDGSIEKDDILEKDSSLEKVNV